jgi:translation initiation factor RLI1
MKFLHIDSTNNKNDKLTNELNHLLKTKKHVFILIFMEGCGPCNATRPEWNKIKNVLNKTNDNILVVDIDKDLIDKVSNLTVVPAGFPTICYINHGKEEDFEDCQELIEKNRTVDSFVEWIKLKTKSDMKGGKSKRRRHSKKSKGKNKKHKKTRKYYH